MLAGDGIGPAVIDEALKVLEAVGFDEPLLPLPFGRSAYVTAGETLPMATADAIREHGVALLGAGGTVLEAAEPSSILRLRRELQLDLLERPVWIEGRRLTLIGHAFEGLYARRDRRDGERVVHERVIQKAGLDVLFAHACARTSGRVTFVDKPSVFHETRALIEASAADHGFGTGDFELVNADAFAASVLVDPSRYETVLALSFVGDVLSDVLAAVSGGVGSAPSVSLGKGLAVFEPIHGTAPRRAPERPLCVNPVGAIRAAALCLEHLERPELARRIHAALLEPSLPRTRDRGGSATTAEVGDAIAAAVARR